MAASLGAMAHPVRRPVTLLAALVLILLSVSAPGAAQSPAPSGSSAPFGSTAPSASTSPTAIAPWPSGDHLRRQLQDIGFAFRIDRDGGDWLGWAPRASAIEGPAVRLGSDGTAPAWARWTFQTLEADLLGADVDSALTAFMEVATRTPLPGRVLRTTFRFLTEELLVEAPILLEGCYASATDDGVVVIRLDTETGEADVLLAASTEAYPDGEDIDDCGPISTVPEILDPGTSRSERLTITATRDGTLEPADTTLEGALVTVVLTFRNDSAEERSLSFAPALEAEVGPVAPGASTLIVLRRLEPGEYPFSSLPDAGSSGVIRVVLPAEE